MSRWPEEVAVPIRPIPACPACGGREGFIPGTMCMACQGEPLEVSAAKASFDEDHQVRGRGRNRSVKRSHRAEGRNWVD